MLLIGLAGFAAGAINALVGSGTLITFPTLVALGYPPVTSTMSNAVGLVAGSVSGTWGYRAELTGQWNRLRWQIPASLAGGVLGAYLLLHLPEKVFAEIVPVLLVLALGLVLIGPRIQSWARRRRRGGGTLTRTHHTGTDDRARAWHVRRRRLRRLLHRRAGHPAGRHDGCVAAGVGAAHERGQERHDAGGESSLRRRLAIRWWHSTGSAGRLPGLSRRARWSAAGPGRVTGVGCRPMHCAAAIVVVGLIGLYRLLVTV